MTLVGFSPRLRPTSASFNQESPPPLSFSAFLLVNARVWNWGPHHTSSTPGLLPPFPLSCRGRGSMLVLYVGMAEGSYRQAQHSAHALGFPLTCHQASTQVHLHSHFTSAEQWALEFNIRDSWLIFLWNALQQEEGRGLPGADSSGLMPGDSILQH